MLKKLKRMPRPALAKARLWLSPYLSTKRLAVIMVGIADSSTETL